MGEGVTITVPALFVKGLPQDLLGGKLLDDDPEICCLYPLNKNQE
jgi:hypothetical protein